jgi:hypothetical protein
MDVSNRTLAVLLIAAIVFSVGGTLMSFSQTGVGSPTGFATNSTDGTVQLTINQAISITLIDSDINFGNCNVSTSGLTNYDSSLGSSGVNNSLCSGSLPDNITIENDGNVEANVTVQTLYNGTTMFGDDNAHIGFFAANVTGDEGCAGTLTTTRTNMSVEGQDYLVCDNLTFGASNDQIAYFAYITLSDQSTSVQTSTTVTFEARVIG